jgi:hypothetical protein
MKLEEFWDQLSNWSQQTFGSDSERGPLGPLKHLAKEIVEVQQKPDDLEEYADLVFLIFDAARRAGCTYEMVIGPVDPIGRLSATVDLAIRDSGRVSPGSYRDMVATAMRAAFLNGFSYKQLLGAVEAKLVKNRARRWPKPSANDEPIEHVRT